MKSKMLTLTLSLLLLSTPVMAEEDISLQQELKPNLAIEQVEVHTYKHDDGASVTEYRTAGKVWMIKVQPVGDFPPYYLYDDEGNGVFERRIGGVSQPSPPMWIIKRF